MKKTALTLTIFTTTFIAGAILLGVFSSYDRLEEKSPNIVVARCITNPPTLLNSSFTDPQINTFTVEILAVVKGTNVSRYITLITEQWLNRGDDYLIYGHCENGACKAIENFRVIPLGRELWAGTVTNAIAGKSPDEQLQTLFKRAIDHLGRQIKKEQEEKQRLETAIRK
jgi:hypothetical protein